VVRARTKFIIGGALVLGAAGYLMATAIGETGMYYLTPGELTAKVKGDSTFYDTGVKMGARVVPGTIERQPGGRAVSFSVTDGSQVIPVTYHGVIPDTFTDSVDVVVEGRYNKNGTFVATTLLAKCASRYENAPDKYQLTPGYKAAKGPAA
jgi:cytochrome c-type biogenesis protein CcmE